MKYEGVFVANVTPFKKNADVDFDALSGHYEFLMQSGVDGLVPCGTTGEGPTLNKEERYKIIELSVQAAKAHSKKVIAGCGSNNTVASLEMIEDAAKAGAHAALVVTPYYNKPMQAGLIAHYQYLAERTPLPLVLYNVPGRTNVNIQPETAAELFKHPKVVGIKEASGNHSQWVALANKINFKEKSLMAGDDDAFATVYALGGCGIISATANVVPRLFVKLYALLKNGKSTEAFQLQTKLMPLVQSMFMETNPSPVKYAMASMKCMENNLRLPLIPVTRKTEEAIAVALKELEML